MVYVDSEKKICRSNDALYRLIS
eukprot:COSAG01_NODE_70831_length_257_cov_1.310127_1_plen_22_part_10